MCYPTGLPLRNEHRKYYVKAPALVEIVQAGAAVLKEYESMTRLGVVITALEEANIVAIMNHLNWWDYSNYSVTYYRECQCTLYSVYLHGPRLKVVLWIGQAG